MTLWLLLELHINPIMTPHEWWVDIFPFSGCSNCLAALLLIDVMSRDKRKDNFMGWLTLTAVSVANRSGLATLAALERQVSCFYWLRPSRVFQANYHSSSKELGLLITRLCIRLARREANKRETACAFKPAFHKCLYWSHKSCPSSQPRK